MVNQVPMRDVSVIIPTYNRDNVLSQVLRCLLNQNPQPLEIIVVDQTKKHDEETELFLDELIRMGKIKHIHQDEPNANMARNRGYLKSKGKIICFFDDDSIINPGIIKAHFDNYKDPTVAAVCGQVFEGTEISTDKLPRRYYRKYTGWMYFPFNFTHRRQTINLPTSNMSVRREIIAEVGGFDENLNGYFEDSDFSFRTYKLCLRKGLKIIYDPIASAVHLQAPGGNRLKGLNEYVVADARAWKTWLYFYLINFGVYASWEILLRMRACIFRKKNMLRPYFFWIAFLEFIIGFEQALRLIRGGRKLLPVRR